MFYWSGELTVCDKQAKDGRSDTHWPDGSIKRWPRPSNTVTRDTSCRSQRFLFQFYSTSCRSFRPVIYLYNAFKYYQNNIDYTSLSIRYELRIDCSRKWKRALSNDDAVCLSVRLSATLKYCHHVGWESFENTFTISYSMQTPNNTDLLQKEHPKFCPE